MRYFLKFLKILKGHIKNWNKEEFKNIFQTKQPLEEQMEHIQQRIILEGIIQQLIKEEGKTPLS